MIEIHTSASCPECGKWLDYEKGEFICSHCRRLTRPEEIQYNLADLYELNIPYASKKFNNRLNKLREFVRKYEAVFLGFDDMDEIAPNNRMGLLDIGWEDGFPDNLCKAVKELKRILR